MTAADEEFMDAVEALPGRYASRIDADGQRLVNSAIGAGEWGEALSELAARLHLAGSAVTKAERDELRSLFEMAGLNIGQVDALIKSE